VKGFCLAKGGESSVPGLTEHRFKIRIILNGGIIMELHKTKNDLSAETREKVIEILNARLADASDLKSQAKQAHWNVKGIHFFQLHELFDQVATAVEGHMDLIAERATSLGGTAFGTVRVAAQRSSLSEYPLEITDGTAHVDALSTALADFGKNVRQNIDETTELGDADTADLFTEISREIDKLLWFVEAHIQT
jgi:starvation-inducible DNA-binding protein